MDAEYQGHAVYSSHLCYQIAALMDKNILRQRQWFHYITRMHFVVCIIRLQIMMHFSH